jgi:hypothetical protein
MNLFCQTGFRRPAWVASKLRAVARYFWGYAGWVGDRVAIEPAGGVSPLRGGAEGSRVWELSTGCDFQL